MNDMIRLSTEGFRRGSEVFPNEGPVRTVRLSPYLIDRCPVTNADFAAFIRAGGYAERSLWTCQGWTFLRERGLHEPLYWRDPYWNQPDQPVTGVSWWEATAYARFVGKTLPTEAQWEYAAGGGTRTYPWGEEAPDDGRANFAPGCEPAELRRSSTDVRAHPLGTAFSGCLDMAGNVGEWCIDNAAPNYAWDFYCDNPVLLVDEASPHVVRGGSGLHDEEALRCASRDHYSPTVRDNIVGLRCVVNLAGEAPR